MKRRASVAATSAAADDGSAGASPTRASKRVRIRSGDGASASSPAILSPRRRPQPPPPAPLPVASFRVIAPAKVGRGRPRSSSSSLRKDSCWPPPEGYLRYVGGTRPCGSLSLCGEEPNSCAIAEYDMDSQDKAWLQLINQRFSKQGIPSINEDLFELIIDMLEKEWFALVGSRPTSGLIARIDHGGKEARRG